jgi:hypothetical protein
MSHLCMISVLVFASIITPTCQVSAGEALQVIESNVQKYKVGDRLDKEMVPDFSSLPLGGVVRFWDPNSKSTMVIQNSEPDVEEGGTRDLLHEKPSTQVK